MVRKLGSTSIIGAALVVSALIVGRGAVAATFTYNDDPVPGGMCGCGSCNCIMVPTKEAEVTTTSRTKLLLSLLSKKQLASVADLQDIHDKQETATVKAQTSSANTATKKTTSTASSGASKASSGASKTSSAASSGSSAASSGASKTSSSASSASTQSMGSESNSSSSGGSSSSKKKSASNPNSSSAASSGAGKTTSSASTGASSVSSDTSKNTSGNSSPASSGSSAASSGASKTTNNASSASDSRGSSSNDSPAQAGVSGAQNSVKDASTGKSKGSYNYTSESGRIHVADNNPDYRSLFLDTSKADFVAPEVKKDSYNPDYFKGSDWRLAPDPDGWTTNPPPGPAGVTEVRRGGYSLEQAANQAKKTRDSTGVYYEYNKTDGTKGYVNSKGIPVQFTQPAR